MQAKDKPAINKTIRVLIVEDSEDDALLLIRQLKREGYNPVYDIVTTASAFQDALEKNRWDIIISDYVLPEFSGLETLQILRDRQMDTPCLVVSGKIDEETAVIAMKAGARDYIMKDNLKRLGPSVKRELAEVAVRRERELAEKALRENEKLSSVLLNGAPNPIVVFNCDFSIRSVNPAFTIKTGFPHDYVIGLKPPFPWWPQDKAAQYTTELRTNIYNGSKDSERLFQTRNGDFFWVNILSSTVKECEDEAEYHISIWTDITTEKRLRDELELLNHRIIQAQEEERKQIARELHEDTAQILAILKLELESLLQSNEIKSPEVREKLGYLKENTNCAIQEIRRYSYELRPGELEHLGLEIALEQMADEMCEPGKLEIELKVNGETRKLHSDIELVLFRIAQESLNNVRKHARATQAAINLTYLPDKTVLMIEDNGKGFEMEKESQSALYRGNLGLVGMRERAKLIGADFWIGSRLGKGTIITVEVKQ